MNIAVDMQPFYSWHSTRGIGRYWSNLVKAMLAQDNDNKYFLINFYGEIPSCRKIGKQLSSKIGKKIFPVDCYGEARSFLTQVPTLSSSAFFKKKINSIVSEFAIQIFFLGAAVDQYSVYEPNFFDSRNCKFVTVAYDLIPLLFKSEYLNGSYAKIYLQQCRLYGASDLIFSISNTTKKDVVGLLGVEENKVKTIYAGIDNKFTKKSYTFDYIKSLKNKYGIKDEYIFSNLADDKRKNIDGIVKAFCSLPDNLSKKYQLVVTCSMRSEEIKKYTDYASGLGLREQVVFTNFIPDDELICLLNNAKLVAFMSMYEGFGFPIIEAWACGVPVVTSNNSSCGEIANQIAMTADPNDISSIRDAVADSLTENNLSRFIEKGFEEVKKYTWEHVAESVLNEINNIMLSSKSVTKQNMLLDLMLENIELKSHLVDNVKAESVSSCDNGRHSLVIYGIGRIGRYILESGKYKEISKQVVAICDNSFRESHYVNIPVLRHNECIRRYSDALYLVTPQSGFIAIISDLLSSGISKENIVFWNNARKRYEKTL